MQGIEAVSGSRFSATRMSEGVLFGESLGAESKLETPFVHDLPDQLAALVSSVWTRYALALALTSVALFGRWLLVPFLGDHVPFALVYAAVVLSSLYLGLGPSIASSALGIICVRLFFVSHGFFVITSLKELSETLTYMGACTLINTATEVVRRSRNKLKAANHNLAAQAETLRTFNEQLEKRVAERTAELKRAEECAHKLGAQVLRLQDEERRRIARDLHDSVGQSVAILNMNLGRLSRSASLSRGEAALVVDSKAIAQDVSDEVRTISYLLHPPLLDEMGLPSALKWYTGGFTKRTGLAVHLDLSQSFGRLPSDFEIAIFRVVQEGLTNIHRHSGSSRAIVRVDWTPNQVALEISDEGRGIPAEKQRAFASGGAMGVGISGMRERVAQLGGYLDLRSNAKGTTVSAIFPLSEDWRPAPGDFVSPSTRVSV